MQLSANLQSELTAYFLPPWELVCHIYRYFVNTVKHAGTHLTAFFWDYLGDPVPER